MRSFARKIASAKADCGKVPLKGHAGTGHSPPPGQEISWEVWGKTRRGFTLLEVLVALTVLSVVLIALHEAFASNIYVTSFTGRLWKAMVYTHNESLRLERSPAPEISFNEGDFEQDHPMVGYHWKREVVDETPIPGIRVRKITLTLSWEEGGASRKYQGVIYAKPN